MRNEASELCMGILRSTPSVSGGDIGDAVAIPLFWTAPACFLWNRWFAWPEAP